MLATGELLRVIRYPANKQGIFETTIPAHMVSWEISSPDLPPDLPPELA